MPQSSNIKLILEMLQDIDKKMDCLQPKEISNNVSDNSILDTLDAMTLLSLPHKLRTTATALNELGYATASDIAKMTHKRRAVESGYLNQLALLGHINKWREGKKVYFSFNERPDNHEYNPDP